MIEKQISAIIYTCTYCGQTHREDVPKDTKMIVIQDRRCLCNGTLHPFTMAVSYSYRLVARKRGP